MPSNCTVCLERLQNIFRCRRPHRECTEPSLTPQQERVWQEVRDLPGVRLRDAGQQFPVMLVLIGLDLGLDVGLRRALALGLNALALALGLTALALLLGS